MDLVAGLIHGARGFVRPGITSGAATYQHPKKEQEDRGSVQDTVTGVLTISAS